jgi:PhnB protein
MKAINPYLNFLGNTEEAFNFYKSVFGGEFTTLQRFRDTPDGDKVPVGEADKIMHVSLPIGSSVLMGTDSLESMGHPPLQSGNNLHLTVEPDSEEEATRIFNSLSAGGKVTMPLARTFWGAYFGMLVDRFGVSWMVNYTYPAGK